MEPLEAEEAKFKIKDAAEASSKPDKPFENPHFGAAFQCVAAGWRPR